jgi:flagellin-like hook-associated protein FlgL
LLLQQISAQLGNTQERLATGNRINSPLDGPVAYFAASALTQRADDLNQLKDVIGQAISTVKAANTGATSIEKLIQQARGLITTAQGQLGTDANSVAARKSLAQQYDTLLRQIDKIAQDSGYQGKNLLLGNGLRFDATSPSRAAFNAITGIQNTQVTNVTASDDYVLAISGNGAIRGSATDIANAERDRGITSLSISGFSSKTNGSFADLTLKVVGGPGQDKTITVTEGTTSFSQTFTQAQWKIAKSLNQTLTFDHQFASGTHVTFDADLDHIEAVPDTAGVGTSSIERYVALAVSVTGANGIGQSIDRSAASQLGQAKLANGQNAFAFDDGTVRIGINAQNLVQSATYPATIGNSYGSAAGAIVGAPVIPATQASAGIVNDYTYTLTATASAANFDFVNGRFTTYQATVNGPGGANNQTVNSDGAVTFTGIADNSQNVTLSIARSGLNGVTVAAASTVADVNGTERVIGNALTGGQVAVTAIGGFRNNTATLVTVNVQSNGSTASYTLTDQYGGTATATAVVGNGTTTLDFTIGSGPQQGGTFQIVLATIAGNAAGTLTYGVLGSFTGTQTARFDVRAAQTGQSATLTTAQVTDAGDGNNLSVALNENNTSNVTIISQNLQTGGEGLALDFAQNGWLDRGDIEAAQNALIAAEDKLHSASSALNNNLDIITERQTYTQQFVNVLSEGATNLVQADQNEEGAALLQLQTRQQLGTIGLSLANQAQQAILRLFS